MMVIWYKKLFNHIPLKHKKIIINVKVESMYCNIYKKSALKFDKFKYYKYNILKVFIILLINNGGKI